MMRLKKQRAAKISLNIEVKCQRERKYSNLSVNFTQNSHRTSGVRTAKFQFESNLNRIVSNNGHKVQC